MTWSVIYFLLLLASASAIDYNSGEGYARGYLGDCPGSNKPATITKKRLKDLTLNVIGYGNNNIFLRKAPYNYFNIKSLAKDKDMDFRKKTMIFVLGYLDSVHFPISTVIASAYKNLGYNVLILDTNAFTTFAYPVASRLMRPIGFHGAEMLIELTQLGLNPKNLELVGLSLGAHTMGFIAKNYRNKTGVSISRLTALDPAGPCFRHLGPEDRLDSSDADFVDMIATNIDGMGMAIPVGHVNFYINGGENQPGDVVLLYCDHLCSHIRSLTVWIAALQHPYSFLGLQCDSVQQARYRDCYERKPRVTNVMGLKTDKSKQGIFYLTTSNVYPYFMGKNGLRRENDFMESYLRNLNCDRDIVIT